MPWWSWEDFQSAQHPPTSGEQDWKFVGEDNETHDSKEQRDMVEADWSQLRQNFSQLHPVAVWEDNRDTDLVIKGDRRGANSPDQCRFNSGWKHIHFISVIDTYTSVIHGLILWPLALYRDNCFLVLTTSSTWLYIKQHGLWYISRFVLDTY